MGGKKNIFNYLQIKKGVIFSNVRVVVDLRIIVISGLR